MINLAFISASSKKTMFNFFLDGMKPKLSLRHGLGGEVALLPTGPPTPLTSIIRIFSSHTP